MQNKSDNQLHAGFFVRLAAYLLDSLIVGVALLVVRIPFWISSIASPDNIVVRSLIFDYSIADIVIYVLGALYFIILTYKTGATIGKKMLHLRVVSTEDRKMSLFEVVYRETVGRFLSALVANVGYFMIGIHKDKRGLHDLLSDTEVIYYHEKKIYVDAEIHEVDAGAKEYVAANYGPIKDELSAVEEKPMLSKSEIEKQVTLAFEKCEGNIISEEEAICPEVAGLQMFEAPLVGIGSAEDELYETLKQEGVVGPWHMLPSEWLPEAKSVISLFFPFTEEVKKSNRESAGNPSTAWLYGRVEGQQYISGYIKMLGAMLEEQGIKTCIPCVDERFQQIQEGSTFGSNWSERHTAYICGLGTFGLSKGIITEKGMAGRFASIIIDKEMVADERKYTGIYDYCTNCGACAYRCPVEAISLEEGKDHVKCNACLKESKEKFAPRYGCGLCQTKVPCESGIPIKR